MLVLSRKVGEQIVLPEFGVTISVVRVAGKTVRLGIAAPADAPVHRAEIWDRICASSAGQRQSNGNGAPSRGNPTKQNGNGVARPHSPRSSEELNTRLARTIVERTGGRIRALRVESQDGSVIVHGRTQSYYARQLALAAVTELLDGLNNEHPHDVRIDIEVTAD